MSHFTARAAAPLVPPRARPRRHRVAVASVGAVFAAAIGVGLAVGTSGGDEAPARTGESNAMGMPVIETPGRATGTASAAGVTVDRARWELGRVPLNVAVRPSWTLRNTGSEPVTLGEPHAEVLEGCCPGPTTLGARTLRPGESTQLTFELSMHPGMDGPHDLALHVPVDGGTDPQGVLTVSVAGDFRS